MFSKTKATTVDNNTTNKKGIPSIITHGTNILGNILSDVVVDIDGIVDGNVKAEQVTVRANGKIVGDVTANAVHIYGEVRGLVRASAVHIYSSARIAGVIVHKTLTVEDGAFVDAKFKRVSEGTDVMLEAMESDNQGFIESPPDPRHRQRQPAPHQLNSCRLIQL